MCREKSTFIFSLQDGSSTKDKSKELMAAVTSLQHTFDECITETKLETKTSSNWSVMDRAQSVGTQRPPKCLKELSYFSI